MLGLLLEVIAFSKVAANEASQTAMASCLEYCAKTQVKTPQTKVNTLELPLISLFLSRKTSRASPVDAPQSLGPLVPP